MTRYLRPRSLAEALRARADHPDWLLLAGGTDVMVGQAGRPEPTGVIDLFGLPDLTGVGHDDTSTLVTIRIGAATTHAALWASPLVAGELPMLAACAREVGALQIQSRGTLGGNVATSSPVGDTLPVLLALDASLELASVRGTRRIPYEDFVVGYRKTALAPDELIAAVLIPALTGGVQHWRKVGTRRAQAISKVMLAASAFRAHDGTIGHARIALGAVADRPIRVHAAEKAIVGHTPTEELAELARDVVLGSIRPITDVRSTAEYRSAVAGNLVRRFVLSLT